MKRSSIAVPFLQERRKQYAAYRENRDARPAGEGGEKRAEHGAHDSRPAGDPAEPRAKHPQQTSGGMALRKKKPRQREQRDGRQRRRHAQGIGFDEHGGRRHAVAHEEQDSRAAEDREDRPADEGGSHDGHQPGPRGPVFEYRGKSNQRNAGQDAGARDRPSPPGPVGAPGKPHGNQRESDRQRQLSHPRGHAGGDDGACLALRDDELNGAVGEDRRHACRDRR